MKETKKVLISQGKHYRNGTAPGQTRGIGKLLNPISIGVEGNEEFLDQVSKIFAQQVIAMEQKEVRKLQEAFVSDPNRRSQLEEL